MSSIERDWRENYSIAEEKQIGLEWAAKRLREQEWAVEKLQEQEWREEVENDINKDKADDMRI